VEGRFSIRVAAGDRESRVVDSYASAPFHYLPYIPASRRTKDAALVTLVNSSGGVVGGDRLAIDVALGRGARLDLATQSATRLYRSTTGAATCVQRLRLGPGAALEYCPDEIIPFAGSDYEQTTEVHLEPGASAILSEVVAAGRLARGERLAFSRLVLDLRCFAAGRLVLRERAALEPLRRPLDRSGILGDFGAWASFHVMVGRAQPAAEMIEEIDRVFAVVTGGCGGASASPAGVVARAVAAEVEPLRDAIARAREIAAGALRVAAPAKAARTQRIEEVV
jgi:urease accessory protein